MLFVIVFDIPPFIYKDAALSWLGKSDMIDGPSSLALKLQLIIVTIW